MYVVPVIVFMCLFCRHIKGKAAVLFTFLFEFMSLCLLNYMSHITREALCTIILCSFVCAFVFLCETSAEKPVVLCMFAFILVCMCV